MKTFEITIQRKLGDTWPVVAKVEDDGPNLPVRTEGTFAIDLGELGDATTYGQVLGQALFRGQIEAVFHAARARSEGLLHVLLFAEADDLKDLHWERLCAPKVGQGWPTLATEQSTPFSLYLPSTIDRQFAPFGRRDLRALVVAANPARGLGHGLEPFDAEEAVAGVRKALEPTIPCDVLGPVSGAIGPATLDEICKRITVAPPTLLHIVAHGILPPGAKEPVLYLATPDNAASPVFAGKVIESLGKARSLPHLAFLSCCEVAAPKAEAAMGGLAQRMVRDLGMPAVVAMTDRVAIKTANALARAFYPRLREHGAVDRALSEAYAGLLSHSNVSVPVPVLFSRLGGRPLFADTPDRELNPTEIAHGLDQMVDFLPERAPILQSTFEATEKVLRGFLGARQDHLLPPAKDERTAALAVVNEVCGEVVDLSFKALALGQEPPPYDGRCPFRGLYPFRAEDRPFFFGREKLTEDLAKQLEDDRFLAVLGSSGSGKSSLVLAGIVPLLCPDEGGPGAAVMTPGKDPVARLDAALAAVGGAPAVLVVDQFEEVFTLCTDTKQRDEFFERVLDLPERSRVVLTMRADFLGDCAPHRRLRERMTAHLKLIPPMNEAELRRAIEGQAQAVRLRFEADLAAQIIDDVRGQPGAMPMMQHALFELWKRRHGRWLRSHEYNDEDKVGGVRGALARTAEALYRGTGAVERAAIRFLFERLARIDVDPIGSGEARRDTRRREALDDLTFEGGDPALTRRLVNELADARLVVTSGTDRVEVEVAHEALIHHWDRLKGWINEARDSEQLADRVRESAQAWRNRGGSQDELTLRGSVLDAAEALLKGQARRFTANEAAFIAVCRKHEEGQARSRARLRWAVAASLMIGLTVALYFLSRAIAANNQLRYRYTRLSVEKSLALAEQGDTPGSIVWAANALANDPGDERIHRLRVGAALRNYPRLVQVLPLEDQYSAIEVSPCGRFVGVMTGDKAYVLEVDHGTRVGSPIHHGASVASLAFSPDGKNFATFAHMPISHEEIDARVEAKRKSDPELFGILNENEIRSAVLPSLDEQRGEVRVWSSEDGKEVGRWSGVMGLFKSIQYSLDGTRLLIVGSSAAIVWEPASGRGETARVSHADVWIDFGMVHPDGQRFVTIEPRGPWKLWNIRGEQLASSLYREKTIQPIDCAALSPDGSFLATSDLKGQTSLWEVSTGELVKSVGNPLDLGAPTEQLAFSPDGRKLAAGGGSEGNGTVRIWAVRDGKPLLTPPKLDHPNPVSVISFSPDGRHLLTLHHQSNTFAFVARVWDGITGRPVTPWMHDVPRVRWSADGRGILTTSVDRVTRIWDVFTANPIVPLDTQRALKPPRSDHGIIEATVGRDATRDATAVAVAGSGASVYDLDQGKLASSSPFDPDRPFRHAILNPDHSRMLAIGAEEAVKSRVFDLKSVDSSFTLDHPWFPGKGCKAWEFSPKGDRLLIAGRNTFAIFEAATGQLVDHPRTAEPFIYSASFSPDGRRVVTAGEGGKARIHNLYENKTIIPLDHQSKDPVRSAQFHPKGKLVVTACDDSVRFWDAADGKQILPALRQGDEVLQATISPDGGALLVVSNAVNQASLLRVWDLETRVERTPGMRLAPISPSLIRTPLAAFSPDSRLILAFDGKGARVWDAMTGEALTPLFDAAGIDLDPDDLGVGCYAVRDHLFACRDSWDRPILVGVGLTPGPPPARVWGLPTDDRAPADLVAWAQLLASRKIDETQTLVSLTHDELTALVDASRKRGELGAMTLSNVTDWHHYVAEECELIGEPFGAAWHLERLINDRSDDPDLLGRLSKARAMLADGKAAAKN